MDVNDFYSKYHRFMKHQANQIMRMYNVPLYLFDDCLNSGYVAVCKNLPNWDPQKGANAMTYLRLAIRKEMASVCRNFFTHRPMCHRVRAESWILGEDDLSTPVDCNRAYATDDYADVSIEETIDLKRSIEKELKVNRRSTSHFLYGVFDRYASAECAKHAGLTRQGVYINSKTVRKHLRKQLEADIS